jgi:hypothetical protein
MGLHPWSSADFRYRDMGTKKAGIENELFERRRFKRIPLNLPVIGKCPGTGFYMNFRGETRDVSGAGLCIKPDSINGLKVGQNIKVKARLYLTKPNKAA